MGKPESKKEEGRGAKKKEEEEVGRILKVGLDVDRSHTSYFIPLIDLPQTSSHISDFLPLTVNSDSPSLLRLKFKSES